MMLSRILGTFLLIVLSPLLIIISIIIYFDDGTPILFKQKRVGAFNSLFMVYKFRTMKKGVPDIPTHLVESPELLFTNTGPSLRKLSADELPQLINIILGNMVFIGPRPALHNQSDLIDLRTQVGVHQLIPGVTGWAQVNGRDELTIREKVEYDEYYLHNRSPLFDVRILVLTFIKVFRMQSVSH
jgi:O-antigen biosynthesis protein WbqP